MTEAEAPSTNKWLIALVVMLPTFIEIMDTSVVNVSLPYMQGSLSAGLDEVTWVLTSYLVSNAIIIPITGWLSSVFGRRRYLIFSITLFTISSIICGASPSLGILVLSRIFQGIGGGGLQPISQAILLETFPQEEHGMAMAVFGMGIVLAPILGPVLGGWITDTYSWRWIFYINVPVGMLAVLLALLFIHDPPYIRRSRVYIDTLGLFFLSVGLGCLQVVLDKGERKDWFNSHFILFLGLIAAISLILFFVVELRRKHPVVNLRIFKDMTFATGNLMMFTGFFCMFGSIVLLPIYLEKLMGYNAMWAGLVLGPGGIASFLVMPLVGILMKRGYNPKYLLAMGLALMAYSLWLRAFFNLEAGFWEIAWPRVVQGFGLGMFFVPLTAVTFANISNEEMGNASSLFNVVRNLGGSFGVAFCTTWLFRRTQFHQTSLVAHVNPFNPVFQDRYQQAYHYLQLHDSSGASPAKALGLIYGQVLRQAGMMAFNDVFWMCAWLTAILVPLTVILRDPHEKAPFKIH